MIVMKRVTRLKPTQVFVSPLQEAIGFFLDGPHVVTFGCETKKYSMSILNFEAQIFVTVDHDCSLFLT